MRAATIQPTERSRRQRRAERHAPLRDDLRIADVAAAFQDAATDALAEAAARAARDFPVRALHVSGGVSANGMLRQKLRARLDIPVCAPPLSLCGDNAAMIGAAAQFRFRDGLRSRLDMDARSSWLLSEDVYA